jgi:predicted GNAT family acetyltransferase
VIPEHRRRGIASAVGAALTRAVFAAGAIPYLQTETRNEQRLYGRLGYRAIGELIAASLSEKTLS